MNCQRKRLRVQPRSLFLPSVATEQPRVPRRARLPIDQPAHILFLPVPGMEIAVSRPRKRLLLLGTHRQRSRHGLPWARGDASESGNPFAPPFKHHRPSSAALGGPACSPFHPLFLFLLYAVRVSCLRVAPFNAVIEITLDGPFSTGRRRPPNHPLFGGLFQIDGERVFLREINRGELAGLRGRRILVRPNEWDRIARTEGNCLGRCVD